METVNYPTVLICVLIMPVVIIALAKMWKRINDMKAEAAAAQSTNPD